MAREVTDRKFKIVAICQVYNELEKGNLERFIDHLLPLVDSLVVYDDGSTDGSYEYLMERSIQVIRGNRNDFANEMYHKQQLLTAALDQQPDFILWLDADEVLSAGAKEKLQELCRQCIESNKDGVSLKEINLWRSATWKRVDSLFDEGWFTRLWRVQEKLSYGQIKTGLHGTIVPPSVKDILQSDALAVIHYGFSSEKHLAYKYLVYRSHGQRGYTMLDRIINEDQLVVERVSSDVIPKDLWVEDEEAPTPRTFAEALTQVEQYRDQVFRPKISIVCLIYKSTDWLKFVQEQVIKYTDLSDKEFFFVANDASPDVLNYLRNNYIPHYVWTSSEAQKKEWYINNVYRAWNFGAEKARGDFVIFINSDMALTPNWVENLFAAYDGRNCVAARLIESGKMRSGQYGIERNFGTTFDTYRENEFQAYAAEAADPTVKDGGLYMPLLIRREHFLSVGGYPEGNAVPGSDPFSPNIAKQGEAVISGDVILMEKLKTKGIRHQTAFSSVVYHFQEGEMDSETPDPMAEAKTVAVANDIVTGTMGEKVLWDFLLSGLPASYGVDKRVVGSSDNFEKTASAYIATHHPHTQVVIQNATFINRVDPSRYTIAFLQDNLRSMDRHSQQQEMNLRSADRCVTNSAQTALDYPEYDFDIIPVGLDAELYRPLDKAALRQELGFGKERIGIFVGNFSEVKGWSKVKECIEHYPDITWILVSKKNETYKAPNVKVYNRIEQSLLAKLLNCADFFIIGSPVETQCLAALEACLVDIPVVMRNVGLFRDWTDEERAKVGIFGDDFIAAIEQLPKKKFTPRQVVLDKKLTVADSVERWQKLLEAVFLERAVARYRSTGSAKQAPSSLTFALEFFIRYRILRPLTGKDKIGVTDLIELLDKLLPRSLFIALRTVWRQILAWQRKLIGR